MPMTDRAPAISVIVPAYGVAHLLPEALASLQAQDFQDWEAVVIDDGAPDDVAGAVAKFAGDSRIRLVQTDNGGVSTARNRAVAASRAPLLAMLDGDDLLEPDYLAKMIAVMDADATLGFVTCDAVYFGAPEREGHRFSRYAPQAEPVTLDRVLAREFNVYIGTVVRRNAYDQVNGFDAKLGAAEDLDLWIRLLEAGWKGAYVAQPLGRYRRRPNSNSWDEARMLRYAEQVYLNSAQRLGTRPEAATSQRMLEHIRRKLRWIEGESLIRAGRPREGVALLSDAHADQRSLRWRLAMPLMRRMPWLAPMLIHIRLWLPPLFPFTSEW